MVMSIGLGLPNLAVHTVVYPSVLCQPAHNINYEAELAS